jgi:cytochrome P450
MSTEAAELIADLCGEEGRRDPYPRYARLRELGDVLEGPDDAVWVTGYRSASALLRDRSIDKGEGKLRAAGFPDWRQRPSLRLMYDSMLVMRPPEHTRARGRVSGVFTARRVAALRPAVARTAGELCDELEDGADFVERFAVRLPLEVIAELLGIPPADRVKFNHVGREFASLLDGTLMATPGVVDRADAAAEVITEYLTALIEKRRAAPCDDLISAMVTSDMATDEMITMAAILLAGGFETSAGLLANGLMALLGAPAQAARLRTEPELARSAVEELLRFDTPVQMVSSRVTSAPRLVGDNVIAPGRRLVILLGSANRDPAVFADPDELVLDRHGEPSLSFGGGVHFCLGAALARLEAEVAFPLLLNRFPTLAIAGEPRMRAGVTLHTVDELVITTS